MPFERHFCRKCVPTLPKIFRPATRNTYGIFFYLALLKNLPGFQILGKTQFRLMLFA